MLFGLSRCHFGPIHVSVGTRRWSSVLIDYRWNHHLLSTVAERPQWLTLKHCAKSYVDAVMKGFPPNHVFLNTPVESVSNDEDGRVRLHLENGKSEVYDHVILATHGDQAHALVLPEADAEERRILSGFKTSKNTAVLHSDLSLMPKLKTAWSSWNYMTKSGSASSNVDQVCLTYNMNILQHIPRDTFGDVLVTLNPLHEPDEKLVQGRFKYSHPLYNPQSIWSQSQLPLIQNTRGISYCGAWTNYGFHEDGFSSGIKVAQDHLGARLPFNFKDSTFSRGTQPVLGLPDLLLRAWISMVQMLIYLIETWFDVRRDGYLKTNSNGLSKQEINHSKIAFTQDSGMTERKKKKSS
jgi:predicted NAD/FAD-binding protein